MVKVKIKDKKSLEKAREKLRGIVDFRKTEWGVIATKAKGPKEKKYNKNLWF